MLSEVVYLECRYCINGIERVEGRKVRITHTLLYIYFYTMTASYFETSDTQLAAYLVTQGYSIRSYMRDTYDPRRWKVIFSNYIDEVSPSVEVFMSNQARSEPIALFAAYRDIKREIVRRQDRMKTEPHRSVPPTYR